MQPSLRQGFYGGLAVAVILGVYLSWLWPATHQVQLHTRHLFDALEGKRWGRFESFIAADYRDQWGHDRAAVRERSRAVFGYLRDVHLTTSGDQIVIDQSGAVWRGHIRLECSDSELSGYVKERVNGLTEPFELEWRHASWKPWDWQLVRVSQPELQIPDEFR